MPSNFTSLSVELYSAVSNYASSMKVNITDDVIDLPIFTDTGTGEVNEARIVLKSPGGKWITGTGRFDKYDRIKIRVVDIGGNIYSRFFEVDDIIPTQSKEEGTLVTLACLGIEYHTQHINFAKPYWFSTAFTPAREVGDVYNANRGVGQPLLRKHGDFGYTPGDSGNGLPFSTINHYEYGLNPISCYNVWLDIINRLGGSVEAGGVFDFFELGFETSSPKTMEIRLFSSGSDPEAKTADNDLKVIKKTVLVNPAEGEGQISNPTGTRVLAIGEGRSGSLPEGRAQFNSGLFQFRYRPRWRTATTYPKDAKVVHMGRHYKAIQTTTGVTPGSAAATDHWGRITMATEFGNVVEYSPWTTEKAALIICCGANPGAATTAGGTYSSTGAGFFDCNITIDDNSFFQTWVDEIVDLSNPDTTSINVGEHGYASGFLPRGYRWLNVGQGLFGSTNPFEDRFGRSGSNAVIEVAKFDDGLGFARSFVSKYQFDSTNDGALVAVLSQGKTYRWNATDSTFEDISAQDLGNHWYHKWSTVRNVEGFAPHPNETDATKFPEITSGTKFLKNTKSAVEIVYDYNSAIADRVVNREAYQSHNACFNFRFPYPPTKFHGIGENVGDLYGGGTKSSLSNFTDEPSTLDIANMGYTPKGNLGFSQEDSGALMPLVSIGFALGLKKEIRNPVGGTLAVALEPTTMRIAMGDTADNTWIYDFEIPTSDGKWYQFDIPLSSFQIYRAHRPRYAQLNNILDLLNPKQIDVQNIFESRNIKWISIQDQSNYDEFGRFAPEGAIADLTVTTLSAAIGGRSTLTIDDLHFKKPLFLISDSMDERINHEADIIHREDIILEEQLRSVAKSQEEIEKFQHKEFDLTTTGSNIFDIRFGDSFLFQNDDLVSDSDESTDNTIKLVAKRIEYSISRPSAGAGGLRRRIKGIKRFY